MQQGQNINISESFTQNCVSVSHNSDFFSKNCDKYFIKLYNFSITDVTASVTSKQIYAGLNIFMMNEQVHLKKIEYGEKVFSCNLLQKVKRSNLLDSLGFFFFF